MKPPVIAGLIGIALAMTGCMSVPLNSGSGATTPGPLATIAVGNCLGAVESNGAPAESVSTMACDDKHHWEVTAVLPAAGDTYPGEDALRETAQNGCPAAFTSYVGVDPAYSIYSASFLAPNASHWTNPDNRKVACLAGSAEVTLKSSVANKPLVFPERGQCSQPSSEDDFGVSLTDCAKAHHFEVYATKEWTGKKVPTATQFDKLYKTTCVDGFKKFVGVKVGKSKYEISYLMVPKKLWNSLKDHRLVCNVSSPDGKATGSAKDAKE